MDCTSRLHLATRIHYALLRQLGSGIDVALMLQREMYALDVVNVCLASDDDELARLAEQFVRASALDRSVPSNLLLPPEAREPQAGYQVSGHDASAPRTAPLRPSSPVRPAPVTPFKVRTPLAAVGAWAGHARTAPAAPRARH